MSPRLSLQIRDVGPDDTAIVEQLIALFDAANAVDAPWELPTNVAHFTHMIRFGSYLEPIPQLAAIEGGVVVAHAYLHLPVWDNLDSAEIGVVVHPSQRRRGLGTLLYAAALERAYGADRKLIDAYGWEDGPAAPFAASVGLSPKYVEVRRRQHLRELPLSLFEEVYAEASAASSSYHLEPILGPTPDDQLEEVADLTGAINDAPMEEMQSEDEKFPTERVRLYEQAAVAKGDRIYRLLARHTATGELAGHTVVMAEAHRPGVGHQHHTSVVRAHRGHRLGLLLKSAMNLLLAQDEPGLRTVDTWNAGSNDHMVAVNERLGYRVMARGLGFQTD